MHKNPPQQFGALSLQRDCCHRLGFSQVWPPCQEPSLALSVTVSLGSKHGTSQGCFEPFLMLLDSRKTEQMVREGGLRIDLCSMPIISLTLADTWAHTSAPPSVGMSK